jgi:hypothetical protein
VRFGNWNAMPDHRSLARLPNEPDSCISTAQMPNFVRNFVKLFWVGLAKTVAVSVLEALRKLSLRDLLLRHPHAAGLILEAEPNIEMVVSSALMTTADGVHKSYTEIQIGTIRRSKARTMNSELIHAQGQVDIID